MTNSGKELKVPILHWLTLFTLVVAQPLFSILKRPDHAPFFTAHQVSALDLYLFVGGWILVLPLIAALLIKAVGAISKRAASILAMLLMLILILLLFLLPLDSVASGAGIAASVAALLFAGFATWSYFNSRWAPMVVTAMSPATLLAPVLFLYSESIQSFLVSADVPEAVTKLESSGLPNVVLLVFDELPLVSLLDEDRRIDAGRYPNFARLAEDGTFYRNTNALHFGTFLALPPILVGSELGEYFQRHHLRHVTGRLDRRRLPHNLFSWLEETHEVFSFESLTKLADERKDRNAVFQESARQRLYTLFEDSAVLAAHILLPEPMPSRLPAVGGKWRDFVSSSRYKTKTSKQDWPWPQKRLAPINEFISTLQNKPWPTLHFGHFHLPHFPFEFNEVGRQTIHSRFQIPDDSLRQATGHNNWANQTLASQAWQAHLLQVAFTDLMLGRILDRLDAIDMYEDTIVVVTSDHGASFFWDEAGLEPSEMIDIQASETFQVPLIIKPAGKGGPEVSDKPLTVADILHTLADLMEFPLPWEGGGFSALGPIPENRIRSAQLTQSDPAEATWIGPIDPDYRALRQKIELFGQHNIEDLYGFGPGRVLLGQDVESLPSSPAMSGVTLDFKPKTLLVIEDPRAAQFIEGEVRREDDTDEWLDLPIVVSINGQIRSASIIRGRGQNVPFIARIPVMDGGVTHRLAVYGVSTDPGNGVIRLLEFEQ